MDDPHLNPFYTYNRDSELIENNLTRAWIVALKILGEEARQEFLQALLANRSPGSGDVRFERLSFRTAEFRLQIHMDKTVSRKLSVRCVLAISSSGEIGSAETAPEEATEGDPQSKINGSVPDAWIFDRAEGYCFLVEAKVGANPLAQPQLLAHASGWLGIPPKRLPEHLVCVTWYDVLAGLHRLLAGGREAVPLNAQENQVVEALIQYLGYFDYHLFSGLHLESLADPLDFDLLPVAGQSVLLAAQPAGSGEPGGTACVPAGSNSTATPAPPLRLDALPPLPHFNLSKVSHVRR